MTHYLLGLHALPRAGKDTLADQLCESYGFVRMAFADELYREVSKAFAVSVELLQSHAWKTEAQGSLSPWNCAEPAFYSLLLNKGFGVNQRMTSRQILQLWGTEYRRTQNAFYWTDKLVAKIEEEHSHPNPRHIVVTDVRRVEGEHGLNEAEALQCFACLHGLTYGLVEITREGTGHTGHSSDDRYPQDMIAATITNNGTRKELLEQALVEINQLEKAKP